MKGKNSPRKHNKLSFVVDRDEIDINSDWVSAVLRSPAAEEKTAHPLHNCPSGPSSDVRSDDNENATVARKMPVVVNAPVVVSASVANATPDAVTATVAKTASVDKTATVARLTPVANRPTVEARQEETGANLSTVAETATAKPARHHKPRRIRAIVDGLTPGQFTVYSLMWQRGEEAGDGKRLYGGGYRALCDLTGMSKRGIQNVIGELQQKEVISIHQAPGYHRTQFSIYQVLGEGLILELWRKRGYEHALGKGKVLSGSTVAL